MKEEDIRQMIGNGKMVWAYLKSNWSKLGLPGSPYSPNEFLACLLLAQRSGEQQDIDQLSKDIKESREIFQQMARQSVISYFLGNEELTSIFVAVMGNKLVDNSMVVPEKITPAPTPVAPVERTQSVQECPHCGHNHEKCRQGIYRQEESRRLAESKRRNDESKAAVSSSCCHVGQDGKCVECTNEETVECYSCDEKIIQSKAHKCQNDDCDHYFCDSCKDSLNEHGYCEDCEVTECDGCKQDFDSGTEIRCANPKCQSNYKYCKECASRLLNSAGLCPDCSGEETLTCADCGHDITASKAHLCKNPDCGDSAYCEECKTDLNEYGFCPSCDTIDCSKCGDTFTRGTEMRCANQECKSDNAYCPTCGKRLLNKKGLCSDCSGEEVSACDGCSEDFTQSLLKNCKSPNCQNSYCPECASNELNKNGRCSECS